MYLLISGEKKRNLERKQQIFECLWATISIFALLQTRLLYLEVKSILISWGFVEQGKEKDTN